MKVENTNYGWSCACSARPGCGNLGPAFELFAGVCMWGFAHLMAHQREANRFESHNFTQPPRRCDSSQRQKHPPAGTFRSNAGAGTRNLHKGLGKFVSDARRDTGKFTTALKRDLEQARKAAPKRHVLQKIRRDIILATCPRMGVILWRVWKKTDSSQSSKNLLPGSWNQVAKKYSNVINTGRFLI